MNREEAIELLTTDVAAWNEYRERHSGWLLDLRMANLSGLDIGDAQLRGGDFRGADLSRADLRGAGLSGANLIGTNLSGANISWAGLHRADLSGADLSGANLTGAGLGGTVFREANLCGVDFSNAGLFSTAFANIDLSGALNLEEVRHFGPSHISFDTLARSQGKISKLFLRGCGVPDVWIENIPSLLGAMQPIQFYSCFISYNHQDEEFCKRLHSRMRDEGLNVWFAPEDLKMGKKIHMQIDEAIRRYDKLLVVLSEDSMQSEWVATEIYKARQREIREKRRILCPIRLCDFEAIRDWECFDGDSGKDMAREIREYFIPGDFMNWKDHDAFETAFRKLIEDLKNDEAPEAVETEG